MISVITIAHNRAGLIGATIRSVLAQSETEFEYLVLDDGSEDDTAAVVSAFSDPRISYERRTHCGRLSILRNAALRRACGAFIAWIDSDDLWEPDHLRKQLAAFTDMPEAGFVFTGVELFGPDGVRQRKTYAGYHDTSSTRFFADVAGNRLAVYPSSLMIRKTCLEQNGEYDESFAGGDADFMMRLAYHCRGRVVPEILTRIRVHPGNHSRSHAAEAHLESCTTLRKLYGQGAIGFWKYRKVAAFHLRWAAVHLRISGKRDAARRLLLQSLALNPMAWRTYKTLIASIGT